MNEPLHISDSIKDIIVCYLSGKLMPEQEKQLYAWLNESKNNKLFFDHFVSIWQASSSLASANQFDADKAWNDVLQSISAEEYKPLKQLRFSLFYKIAVAASLLLFIGLGSFFIGSRTNTVTEQFTELQAPRGSKTTLTLPDGSQVWLNSGSKLRFSNLYGKSTRDIQLSGEAFFVVAKNKKVPFSVFADGVKVTALGTSFNVKAYAEEKTVEAVLEEGVLKVGMDVDENAKGVILYPKQKVTYVKNCANGDFFQVDSVKNMGLYTSWRDKRWVFRHETFGELVKKLERRYDVNFIFKDNSLKDYKISGSLQDESVEQILRVLQLIAPIRYKIEHDTIELSIDKNLKKKYESMHLMQSVDY